MLNHPCLRRDPRRELSYAARRRFPVKLGSRFGFGVRDIAGGGGSPVLSRPSSLIEGIVVGVADAACRQLDACLDEALVVADRQILHGLMAVMAHAAALQRFPAAAVSVPALGDAKRAPITAPVVALPQVHLRSERGALSRSWAAGRMSGGGCRVGTPALVRLGGNVVDGRCRSGPGGPASRSAKAGS